MLGQPVDKAICETGNSLPRFLSSVSSAHPGLVKEAVKWEGLLKTPPPTQTHMQRALTAAHKVTDPWLRW